MRKINYRAGGCRASSGVIPALAPGQLPKNRAIQAGAAALTPLNEPTGWIPHVKALNLGLCC